MLALAVAGAACATPPSIAEWAPTWDQARAAMPPLDTPIAQEDCERALATLRTVAPDLESTPDEVLDLTVDRWKDLAEDIMFECPHGEGADGFRDAYAELDLLEREITSLIAEIGG